jgi:hypothetical protein
MKMVRRENKMKEKKKTKRIKEPRLKYAAEKRKGMKSIKRFNQKEKKEAGRYFFV